MWGEYCVNDVKGEKKGEVRLVGGCVVVLAAYPWDRH